MSARTNQQNDNDKQIAKLRGELEDLKAHTRVVDVLDATPKNVHSHEFDQLSSTEQSAASLGVDPSSWKPISFLNNKHYDALVKANMLDDDLARRIEAYKSVSQA
tara:strand:- start:477 stop:791 length:315 start_codon:yes stop_codon:yes gene_type:complete